MSGYELADGTLSTEYKIGDKFILNENHHVFRKGDTLELFKQDFSDCPKFKGPVRAHHCHWRILIPVKKQFTKSDLKDGMKVVCRDSEDTLFFLGGILIAVPTSDSCDVFYKASITAYREDLTFIGFNTWDIMKVIDRDGAILFERVEKSQQEIEMDKLQKQIAGLQEQANKLKAAM